jgi:plastocyanin
MRRLTTLALILGLALAASACSSGEKVGSGIDVKKLNEKARRLGEFEATKKKGGSAGGFVGEQEKQQAEAQRQAAQQEAAQEELNRRAEEESAVEFTITSSGYDPYYIRVFQGGVIQVTNNDTQARTVTADRGEFDSGSIAPGGKWTYAANTVGKFNFHDETRPFVVGTLEVIAG